MFTGTLQMTGALLLSYVFLTASLHKLTNFKHFQQQLSDYDLLPQTILAPTVLVLALMEAIGAICLLVAPLIALGAIVSALLLTTYMIAISLSLMRGKKLLDCGCGKSGQQLSPWLLVRNLILLCAALSLIWFDSVAEAIWLLVVPTAVVAAGLYLIGEQLLINKSQLDNLGVYRG